MQKFLLGFILLILALHSFGNIYNWYWRLPWFDIPMHMAGGAFVACFFLYLFGERWKNFDMRANFFVTFTFGLGAVAMVGIAWEFYEYLSQVFIERRFDLTCAAPGGLFDTLLDLFDDLFGGAIALLTWRHIDSNK